MMRKALAQIGIVFEKESLDNLRDRRSIMSALVSTLLTPSLLIALIVVMGKTILADASQRNIALPVVGAENAPSLVQFLSQNGVDILPAPQDPESAVQNGDYDAILIIPPDFSTNFSSSQPAPVQIIMDSSRQSAMATVDVLGTLLNQYGGLISNLRLLARGVNPSITQTLSVVNIDTATPKSQVMIFLNMMPFLLLLVIFTGGMYVVIDTTAGERERNSLEPLLINPIPRWQFVLGKFSAAIPFVAGTLAVTLGAYALGFNLVPMEEYIGRRVGLDISTIVSIFVICLPIILLATALQMVVATFTHSFKEAQTYVGLMAFVPGLPGAFLAFIPMKADLWKMLIPTFGQQLLINQVLRGEAVSITNLLVSEAVTILSAGLILFLAIKLYEREQVLFGNK
ncbi:MAG: ABC transporter permease [Omnitrophica WOR_2 bacterium]